ncbi:MAG TPA: hypothetical protein VHG90_04460 [Acidimicrobiales bacterium]|nr:hypothetical protein [Acidimicrobiales bacterium]
MARVESALSSAASAPDAPGGPLFVGIEGDDDIQVARVRSLANIPVDLPSGSARPFFGPAIRLAKRVVRRGLRWYVGAIMDEQTQFNHAVLDLVERVRLRTERLHSELRLRVSPLALAPAAEQALRGCQRVLLLGSQVNAARGTNEAAGPPPDLDWLPVLERLPPATVDGLLLERPPSEARVLEAARRALTGDGAVVFTGAGPELAAAATAAGFVDVQVEPGVVTARCPASASGRP